MSDDDVIRAARLDDPVERAMLADYLEERGRAGESALCRGSGTIEAGLASGPVGKARWSVLAWHERALTTGSTRCRLADWLEGGPTLLREIGGYCLPPVITDRAPERIRGRWGFDAGAEPYLAHSLPPCLYHACAAHFGRGPEGVLIAGAGEAEGHAMTLLGRACLDWALCEG